MNPHGLGSKAFPIGAHLGRRSSHLYKAAGNSTLMFIIVIRKWTALPLREREHVVRYEGRYIRLGHCVIRCVLEYENGICFRTRAWIRILISIHTVRFAFSKTSVKMSKT